MPDVIFEDDDGDDADEVIIGDSDDDDDDVKNSEPQKPVVDPGQDPKAQLETVNSQIAELTAKMKEMGLAVPDVLKDDEMSGDGNNMPEKLRKQIDHANSAIHQLTKVASQQLSQQTAEDEKPP